MGDQLESLAILERKMSSFHTDIPGTDTCNGLDITVGTTVVRLGRAALATVAHKHLAEFMVRGRKHRDKARAGQSDVRDHDISEKSAHMRYQRIAHRKVHSKKIGLVVPSSISFSFV